MSEMLIDEGKFFSSEIGKFFRKSADFLDDNRKFRDLPCPGIQEPLHAAAPDLL